jgi:azurin
METHTSDKGSIWTLINFIVAAGFSVFSIVAAISLIYGGIKYSRANPKPAVVPVAAAPMAATSAPAPAPAPAAGGDVISVTIKPGAANPMSFDQPSFVVKAGQKVKLTFANQSAAPLQHNLILCKPGSLQNIITAANGMMMDMPKWMAKGFIPESPDMIAHTKLLNPNETETLEFTAPAEKGDYPYVCTFPGHSAIMNGIMKVE